MTKREPLCFAGGVSATGAFNMISYSGLDDVDALLELIDNAFDWRHNDKDLNIKFIVTNDDELLIIDNAMGMTYASFKKMFILYNQDLDGPNRRGGICGYGTKAALKKMCSSENTKHTIITKHNDGDYYTQETDWSKVTTMTDGFPIYESSLDEIALFKQYNNEQSGTIIKIGMTDELREILHKQFTDKINKDLKLNKHFKMCYSIHENANIHYKYKNEEVKELTFINLFKQENDKYLNGMDGRKSIVIKSKYNIKTQHELVYIIVHSKYYYIHKKLGNCPTKPTGPMDNLPHISDDGNIVEMEFTQHLCCLKPLDSYFNHNNPKLPSDTGLTVRDSYRTKFFGDDLNDDINAKMLVCRNDTIIGNINIGKIAKAGSQFSAYDKFEKIHTSTQLDYVSTSNQTDKNDMYMGTQQNKHQYEKSDTRKALWRMCDHNRKAFTTELWTHMDNESKEFIKQQQKLKARCIILNAYRVYKLRKIIQDRTNLKPKPRSPSPIEPMSPSPIEPRSPSPVEPRSPSPVKSHDEIQKDIIKELSQDMTLNQTKRDALKWILTHYEFKCNTHL